MEEKPKTALPVIMIRRHLTPGHILKDYLYTVVISVVIALFLKFAGFSEPFLPCRVFSLSLGLTICTLAVLMIWLFNPKTDNLLVIGLLLAGSVVGAVLLVSRLSVLFSRFGIRSQAISGRPFRLKP
jgi:uncharacterized membrane protein